MRRVLLAVLLILSIVIGLGHGSAMPLFSETSKRAVFLSPLERWMPTWNLKWYLSELQGAGYQVDVLLNENVSISFLMTGLANYDIIILRTDSFDLEGYSYFCSGEPVTSKTRTIFAGQISSNELQVAACLGFSALFLQHNYPANSFKAGLVYALGSGTADLSSAFLAAGAAVFVGYDNANTLQWGRLDALSIKLFGYLSKGYSVKESIISLWNYLHTGHAQTANWPSLYWTGNGDFKI